MCPHLCRLLLFLELCPPWRKALVKGDHAVPACPVAGVLFIGHPSGLNELASLSHDLAPVIKAKTGHDDRVGRLEGYRPVPDAGHIGQGAFVVKIHEQMPVGLKQRAHGVGLQPFVKGQYFGQVIHRVEKSRPNMPPASTHVIFLRLRISWLTGAPPLGPCHAPQRAF